MPVYHPPLPPDTGVWSLQDLPAVDEDGYIHLANTTYKFRTLVELPADVTCLVHPSGTVLKGIQPGSLIPGDTASVGLIGNSATRPVVAVAAAGTKSFRAEFFRLDNLDIGGVLHVNDGADVYNMYLEGCGLAAPGFLGEWQARFFKCHWTAFTGFTDGLKTRGAGWSGIFEECLFVQAGAGNCIDFDVSTPYRFRFRSSTMVLVPGGYGFMGNTAVNFTSGKFLIDASIFDGAGTALAPNINQLDLNVDIQQTAGAPNSATVGVVRLSNNATQTTFSAANTYTDVVGVSAVTAGPPRFDNGGANNCSLRYLGTGRSPVLLTVDLSLYKTGTATDYNVRLIKNGVTQLTSVRAVVANGTQPVAFTFVDVNIAQNDTFKIQIACVLGTTAVTVLSAAIITNFKS